MMIVMTIIMMIIMMMNECEDMVDLLAAECPENCWNCTDNGSATRCKSDRCKYGYVYKVADGTCNRE